MKNIKGKIQNMIIKSYQGYQTRNSGMSTFSNKVNMVFTFWLVS